MVLSYFIPSRKTVTKTVGFFGGVYLTHAYIQQRLEEVKQKLEVENNAQDNLKRRFQQTHETTSYTILALLPTLSSQVLGEMNVEEVTKELKSRSSRKAVPPPIPSPSISSSIEVVQDQGASVMSLGVQSIADSASGSGFLGVSASLDSLRSEQESLSGSASVASGPEASGLSDSIVSHISASSSSSDSRTKAELWNEVKMLTLTRTLTTLYSITLLCLLTTLQLTLLARSKYVQSVIDEEEQERLRENIEAQLTLSNMLFQGLGLGGGGGGFEAMEKLINGLEAGEVEGEDEGCGVDEYISEATENKYLTMSWWLLHVGWKDVGERVRRGVEEVFEGVSLKTKLSAMDLHRLVGDVRRRVEHEVTFEGNEKRTNFLSSLLPSTPETIHHTLVQGGFLPSSVAAYHLNPDTRDQPVSTTHPSTSSDTLTSSQLSQSQFYTRARSNASDVSLESSPASSNPYPHISSDPKFLSLIKETRSVIQSPDFARVLEVCLDQSVDVLFQGLMKNVFVESAPPETLNEEPVRVRLAGLLPGLSRWSRLALDGLPNELVDILLSVHEVPCLSAILFGKFEEQFR